jgi:hypothetical protein
MYTYTMATSNLRLEIGNDCSFASSAAFRGENQGSFGHDLKNRGPVSKRVWHVKETLAAKQLCNKGFFFVDLINTWY